MIKFPFLLPALFLTLSLASRDSLHDLSVKKQFIYSPWFRYNEHGNVVVAEAMKNGDFPWIQTYFNSALVNYLFEAPLVVKALAMDSLQYGKSFDMFDGLVNGHRNEPLYLHSLFDFQESYRNVKGLDSFRFAHGAMISVLSRDNPSFDLVKGYLNFVTSTFHSHVSLASLEKNYQKHLATFDAIKGSVSGYFSLILYRNMGGGEEKNKWLGCSLCDRVSPEFLAQVLFLHETVKSLAHSSNEHVAKELEEAIWDHLRDIGVERMNSLAVYYLLLTQSEDVVSSMFVSLMETCQLAKLEIFLEILGQDEFRPIIESALEFGHPSGKCYFRANCLKMKTFLEQIGLHDWLNQGPGQAQFGSHLYWMVTSKSRINDNETLLHSLSDDTIKECINEALIHVDVNILKPIFISRRTLPLMHEILLSADHSTLYTVLTTVYNHYPGCLYWANQIAQFPVEFNEGFDFILDDFLRHNLPLEDINILTDPGIEESFLNWNDAQEHHLEYHFQFVFDYFNRMMRLHANLSTLGDVLELRKQVLFGRAPDYNGYLSKCLTAGSVTCVSLILNNEDGPANHSANMNHLSQAVMPRLIENVFEIESFDGGVRTTYLINYATNVFYQIACEHFYLPEEMQIMTLYSPFFNISSLLQDLSGSIDFKDILLKAHLPTVSELLWQLDGLMPPVERDHLLRACLTTHPLKYDRNLLIHAFYTSLPKSGLLTPQSAPLILRTKYILRFEVNLKVQLLIKTHALLKDLYDISRFKKLDLLTLVNSYLNFMEDDRVNAYYSSLSHTRLPQELIIEAIRFAFPQYASLSYREIIILIVTRRSCIKAFKKGRDDGNYLVSCFPKRLLKTMKSLTSSSVPKKRALDDDHEPSGQKGPRRSSRISMRKKPKYDQ